MKKQINSNNDTKWKQLTHSAASCKATGDTDAGVNVVVGNANIKAAIIVMIPITSDIRGGTIIVFKYKSTGSCVGQSTYYCSAGYVYAVTAIVDFSGGNIGIKCPANSWGLSTIAVSVAANSIYYKRA